MTQTIIVGGSTDSDTADVTVRPVRSPASPAVTTLTPPASRRMASRSVGSARSVGGFTAIVIALPSPQTAARILASSSATAGRPGSRRGRGRSIS